jgi:hypothetical protein
MHTSELLLSRLSRHVAVPACLLAGALALNARDWPDVHSMPLMPAVPSASHPDFPGLPAVLRLFDFEAGNAFGEAVEDSLTWRLERRPEIIAMFRHYMYGHEPPAPGELSFEIISTDPVWLNGAATKRVIRGRLYPMDGPVPFTFTFSLYLPNASEAPPPVIICLNNSGDTTIEPGGSRAHRWDLPGTLDAGIALITADQGAFSGDSHSGWPAPLIDAYADAGFTGDWQTLAAWAWGISRLIDYVESNPELDRHRIALTGFSRRGKAAMWAGALDSRAALVAPHQGGFAGGSPVRTDWGIGTGYLTSFQYWFRPEFIAVDLADYDRWPFDGNTVLAAIAPRRVYLSQNSSYGASETGIRGLVQATRPAWELLGLDPLQEVTYYYDPVSTHQFEPYHWERIYTEVQALPLGGVRGFHAWLQQAGLPVHEGESLEAALSRDDDRDGLSAIEEYLFATNPTSPDSFPPLRLSRAADGSLHMQAVLRRDGIGHPGLVYSWRGVHQWLEWAPRPDGPWTPFVDGELLPVQAAPGFREATEIISFTDQRNAPAERVFYRVAYSLD